MTSKTRIVAAEIPSDMADRIEQLAEQLGRSPSWVVEDALACWLDREEEHYQMTLEALADVDAGRVVDHEEVRAWTNSLGTKNPLPMPKPK